MAYRPKLSHLFRILFGKRDSSAAQGLFLEGKIEYDAGNFQDGKLMFYYGMKLDPDFAGNFYNYAVAVEKEEGKSMNARRAWESYLDAASRDTNQSEQTRHSVREHLEKYFT